MQGFWIENKGIIEAGSVFVITEADNKELEEISMEGKRLSDLDQRTTFEGDNIKIDDIENQEILLLNFEARQSNIGAGRYARIQAARAEGQPKIVFNGSETILKRLEELVEKHGIETVLNSIVIVKKRKSASGKNYWTIE